MYFPAFQQKCHFNLYTMVAAIVLCCVTIATAGAVSVRTFAGYGRHSDTNLADGVAKIGNQQSPVSVRIVWVDHIAQYYPADGGRLEQRFDLWTLQVGVAVRHESEKLGDRLSEGINSRCAWFPRQVVQMQRLGSDDPQSITMAPEVKERYAVPFDLNASSLRYPHTFEMDDGTYTTLGVTRLVFMDEPKLPSVYQLRFIEDGDWPSDHIAAANNDWFPFVLSRSEEPEDSHITDRISWKSFLEE